VEQPFDPNLPPARVSALLSSDGRAALISVKLTALSRADRDAGSWRVGAFVSGGFVVVAIALVGAGAAFVRLVQPLARVRWFPLRHAVIGLGRPGHQTRVILVTVGLGCFFILATPPGRADLAARLSLDLRPDAPDLFFVDVRAISGPASRRSSTPGP
jgi:predicted lysophospholipase L1 biosynthesis ABC-type transport system permease subunit